MAPRCEGRIHSVLFRRERCCREAAWSNVTYVRGASTTMAAQRPHLSATRLKLDPGTGLAQPRDVSRAAWGGGRIVKPTRSARPVTDQGQLCISARLSDTHASTPSTDPATATSNHRPPPWLQDNGSRSEPSSFQREGGSEGVRLRPRYGVGTFGARRRINSAGNS